VSAARPSGVIFGGMGASGFASEDLAGVALCLLQAVTRRSESIGSKKMCKRRGEINSLSIQLLLYSAHFSKTSEFLDDRADL
jgi:hypothetical protein